MKKLINVLSFALFVVAICVLVPSCATKSEKKSCSSSCCKSQISSDVMAYYFHSTRRCATCEAVEKVTKDALNEYFGDKVSFVSVNREDENSDSLVNKFNVSGQTLIIVKGEKIVNLTNFAFLNARTSPDKLKAKLKETIDSI